MQEQIKSLEKEIQRLCENKEFKHHEWYFPYHLQILSLLCEKVLNMYPTADKYIVRILVWVHDLGKIVSAENPDAATLTEGKILLQRLNFEEDVITRVLDYCELLDTATDFITTPLEVQILSSADGASHFIGPFYGIYCYENPHNLKSFDKIMASNIKKANKDWQKKIVLSEVQEMIRTRYDFVIEQNSVNIYDLLEEAL